MTERFEIAIVGGGPAGLAAGVQAARSSASHVLLERGEIANTIHRYQKGKHVMAEPSRLPLQQELALHFEAGLRETVLDTWRRDIEAVGVNLRRAPGCEVTAVTGEKGRFALELKDGSTLEAASVVLAIGLQGNIRTFGVPGDELPYVTYHLDDPAAHVGKRIVVVGVGDAGIENALALADHDNEVTIVNRFEEFDRAKPRNRALIEAAIKAGRITHLKNANVQRFQPSAIVLTVGSEEVLLEIDLVIGRLGALPPRRFLEQIGIVFPSADREALPELSETLESNVPGIYLVGALTGRPLIKSCLNQGFEVVEHILGHAVKPADEPLLREILGGLEGSVESILERIRRTIPLFSGLTTVQLREFLVDSRVHVQATGQVVYARNDFSDSLYSILEGGVEVELPLSDEDRDSDLGAHERNVRRVPLGVGEFFGEGSLLSGRRRAGTVRAAHDSVLIETSRLAMQKLIKSVPAVARVIDRTGIARRLETVVPALLPEERDRLASAAELYAFQPGQLLFAEGDKPDGLHLIRRGSVAVLRKRDGHESPVNYVQAGNYVGEVALIEPDSRRGASVRALVLTETIRVPTDSIREVMLAHPELREGFARRAREYQVQGAQALEDHGGGALVDFLIAQGAKEATDLLVIDESLCIRCDNCEKACADTHQGVSRLDREGGPRFANLHLPTACQHCENPKCMLDCPPDAIRRHPTGEVYIQDNCIGCGNCAANCPYGVIQMAVPVEPPRRSLLWRILFGEGPGEDAGVKPEGAHEMAVKCDLCRNLPARAGGEPRAACVASCPTGAIVRVRPSEFIQEILGGGGQS